MQRGVADGGAADEHRLESRHRRQRAGAADLEIDLLQHRVGLLGRELVGDRPARLSRDAAEFVTAGEVVEFEDDAVDLESELGTLPCHRLEVGDATLDALNRLDEFRHRQTEVAQRLQDPGVRLGHRPALHHAEAVGEEGQRAAGGDGGVELAQRARRTVARIHRRLLAPDSGLAHPATETGERQIHLTAHLQHRGRIAPELARHGVDGAQVGSDVLAGRTIAACRAAHQQAVLVSQRNGQTIELRFGGVVHALPCQGFTHTAVEVDQLALVHGLAQREHRHAMQHRFEARTRRAADALRRRVRRHQFGVCGLQRAKLVEARVVLGVRNLRCVEQVVAVVLFPEPLAQLGHTRGTLHRIGFARAHCSTSRSSFSLPSGVSGWRRMS